VNTAATLSRVRTQFESIPSQPPPPPVDVSQPPQEQERRLTVEDPLARLPRVDIGYRIPSTLSPDDDAIDMLAEILAGGRSSRFYEHIVRQQQRAVRVNAFAPNSRGPRLFAIEATPAPGTAIETLEQAIYADIDGVKAGPIAEPEIEKARNTARRQFMGSLATSLSLARTLAENALYFGDPGRINTRWDRLAKFSAADVQRVARQYLTPENRTVVISMPNRTPSGDDAGGGAR